MLVRNALSETVVVVITQRVMRRVWISLQIDLEGSGVFRKTKNKKRKSSMICIGFVFCFERWPCLLGEWGKGTGTEEK